MQSRAAGASLNEVTRGTASVPKRLRYFMQRFGAALRLAYPLHRKALCRTVHFGGEPAPQGFAASQAEGFPSDRWLFHAA
jgi:hypothetical protein